MGGGPLFTSSAIPAECPFSAEFLTEWPCVDVLNGGSAKKGRSRHTAPASVISADFHFGQLPKPSRALEGFTGQLAQLASPIGPLACTFFFIADID